MSLLVELHIIPWLLQHENSKIENLLDDLDGLLIFYFHTQVKYFGKSMLAQILLI